MYIVFNKHIDNNSLEEFIDKVNSVDGKGIVIYLSSIGGECDVVPVIRDIIEDNNIHLVTYGLIASSALDLFLTTKTSREVLDESYALLHKTVINTSININLKHNFNKYLSTIMSKEVGVREMVNRFLEVTNTEIKDIKKGVDVYYGTDRLRKALTKSKKFFENSLVVSES